MSDKETGPPTESSGYFRDLSGWVDRLTKIIFIAMPLAGCFFIMDVPFYLEWSILREQYYGLILAMILPCTFILVPMSRKSPRDRVPWYDAILAVLGAVVGLYVAIFYLKITLALGTITPDRVILGTIGIFLILEASRRVTNWFLASFGLFFILFPHLSWLFPDLLSGLSLPFSQQVNYLFLETNAMLGIIFGVAAIIVLAFILFGNLLFSIGGGAFITNVAMAAFGRFRGGPGKMAVVGSSLFGTISGVAVANVATTGVVTIPLMKRIGYRNHIAGAIEAVASTGGQICPPIMGATAFVMAEVLGIPYQKVAIAAIIPAFLYYTTIFFQVDMEAGKSGLKGLPREQLPKIFSFMGKSPFFIIPFAVLLVALFVLYLAPAKAALIGVASILILGFFFQKETRFRLHWILDGLHETGRALVQLGSIAALAGIVVGTISYTGFGFIISLYLGQLAGGNLFILLPIVAVASLIMGMGMPTLSVYIVLAILLAPTMVQLGVEPIAAHLFILYLGTASMVTPPVCIAAYAAAAIANASPIRTGFAAARFGVIAYIVPFLFIFFPALLFQGSPGGILVATVTALFGCFALSAALTGYLFQELSPVKRILFALAGIGLMIPIKGQSVGFCLLCNLTSAVIMFSLLTFEWKRKREIGRISKPIQGRLLRSH
ncbi:MAG TPA: TRAP transporter fused permease subunit [Desulfatiglandales bacterium]|nr:TRAP transporter fused permease subunit [Desulfatiglandales bacterium]